MPAKIERTFRLVLGLSFLPERMRRWLFDKGTRAIEVLNATIFASWGAGGVSLPEVASRDLVVDGRRVTHGDVLVGLGADAAGVADLTKDRFAHGRAVAVQYWHQTDTIHRAGREM